MAMIRVMSLGRRSLAMQTLTTGSYAAVQLRLFSSGSDDDFVALHPSGKPHITNTPAPVSDLDDLDDLDDVDAKETVAIGPSGVEYGGPTRGGKLKEPTRFGDWERKGRCSDF